MRVRRPEGGATQKVIARRDRDTDQSVPLPERWRTYLVDRNIVAGGTLLGAHPSQQQRLPDGEMWDIVANLTEVSAADAAFVI